MSVEFFCQATGIVLIVGSFILIFKEKVYLDATTNEPVSVELPVIGKLKTNAPIFAVIVLGVLAVMYPVYIDHTTFITVRANVKSDSHPVVAYATAEQATSGDNDDALIIFFPQLALKNYSPHLIVTANGQYVDHVVDLAKIKKGEIDLGDLEIQTRTQTATVALQTDNANKPQIFK